MLALATIRNLLEWHVAMGADEAIDAEPVDWFERHEQRVVAAPAMPAPVVSAQPVASAQPAVSASRAGVIAKARELADAAQDVEALKAAVMAFDGCELKKLAKHPVFADGNPNSEVMFIGEAPGADEDRQGIPFCGVSGQLLDEMLGHIGLKRAENFYITNTLFWRPPGNRTPTADEIEICRPLVEKHIALIAPKVLVLVGGTAAKSVLNETRGITRLRGQAFSYKNQYLQQDIPVLVMFHPSYLLRQPLQKKQAWFDLLALKERLQA